MIEKAGGTGTSGSCWVFEGKALNVSPGKDETMQAFVITAYKDYEALKTLTLALSRRGLWRLRRGRWTN